MTPRELLAELHVLGVEVYRGPAGGVCLYPGERVPDALRRAIRAALGAVLAELDAMPPDDGEALSRACQRVGADFGGLLSALLPADITELALARFTPPELDAFVRAVDARHCRLAGRAPATWTTAATCRHCGPVLLWPDAPETLDACPWCWSRRDGLPIPRPAGSAEHSVSLNPEEGHPDELHPEAVAERA